MFSYRFVLFLPSSGVEIYSYAGVELFFRNACFVLIYVLFYSQKYELKINTENPLFQRNAWVCFFND